MTAATKQGAPIVKDLMTFQPINREGQRTLILAEDGTLGFRMYSGRNHKQWSDDDSDEPVAVYPGYIPIRIEGLMVSADGDTQPYEMSAEDAAKLQTILKKVAA